MAQKTAAEKADELQILVASITQRLNYLEKEIGSALAAQGGVTQAVTELALKIADVKRDVSDLGKWRDAQVAAQAEKSRRLWALTPNLLAAIITVTGGVFNVILAALIAYLISRKP